jgi:putative membrane-bound dehydrogenase-like protein
MLRSLLAVLSAAAVGHVSFGQGFTPAEAVKRMQLPPGYSARVVASEPMIRQPLSISFDERGRLWVLQYLQYPNPAGLTPVKQDQYLRTVWDKVPEPPPRGPKGADRLTILFDPDDRGVFRKSKDFVTGLNVASGFCVGHGGVFVVQPPYLLFYPDRNADDVPDGNPEVLLLGFGMEDTHSLANSLQWGPDGWLYGAAGSTSTCRIRNPAGKPTDPPVEFQQGIWRYHPATKRFELFSEGGGNTYGLDFDKHGQVIAGTNWGGFAMLHQFQGAYYVKGFAKHGPLHNAHAYGYFDHVPYTNFKGGHVTCGGVVYQGDAYPTELHDQYVAGNLLSNAVYWHRVTPKGASFTAAHGGDLLVSNDTWFRPVDLILGPDGAVYVADWYDRRAAHLDPIDNWDRTNGRVYRIEYQGGKPFPTFDLRKKTSRELLELLKHPNAWWRREARRLLAERRDAETYPTLKQWVREGEGLLPLEALWAAYTSRGLSTDDLQGLFAHPNEHVRAWSVRLLGDDGLCPETTLQLAYVEKHPVVRAQLACTAKRVPAKSGVGLVKQMLRVRAEPDPHLGLLMWWAVESHMAKHPHLAVEFAIGRDVDPAALYEQLVERIARRLLADDIPNGSAAAADVLKAWSDKPGPVLRGISAALDGVRPADVDPKLQAAVAAVTGKGNEELRTSVQARLGDSDALAALRGRVSDPARPDAERAKAIDVLRQVRDEQLKPLLLGQLAAAKSEALRMAILAGLEPFDDPRIGEAILAAYPRWPAAVKKRAVQALVSRKPWAAALFAAVDSGKVPPAEVTLEQVRAAVALGDASITNLVAKHYGRVGPATPGEKQARISWLNTAVSRGKGDATAGKALYTQHCAKCHTLYGEGNKVGPDLTTADRKNRQTLLANIIDPGAVIRPEYVTHSADLTDGRKLVGLVVESSAQSVTLLDAENKKTVISRGDLEDLKPLPTSLMPDKLLDTLTDQQVCDLFAFMASDPPARPPPGK